MTDTDHRTSTGSRRDLSLPEQLEADFGPRKTSPASQVIGALYELLTSDTPKAKAALSTWKTTVGDVYGPAALDEPQWSDTLAEHFDLDTAAGMVLLVAIHTYFAVVVKLIAARALHILDWEATDDPIEVLQLIEDDATWEAAGPANLLDGDIFGWHADCWTSRHAPITGSLLDTTSRYQLPDGGTDTDVFKPLYQSLFPTDVRHDLGEYYTPRWLAELTLDEAGYAGDPGRRILDPACGSGTFLVEAIRRARRRAGDSQQAIATDLVDHIIGFDINPLAVLAARVNIVLALGNWVDELPTFDVSVYCCDSLPAAGTVDLFAQPRNRPDIEPVDIIAGNPPWVHWEHLPPSRREELKPLWQSYGLFSLDGSRGRMGGGKKDLSMLFTYACADEYLNRDGTLAFLITQSVFQSRGAGDGFRRFRYPSGGQTVYLRPTIVHDLTDFQPFDNASTQTALLVLNKGDRPVDVPVPYRRWTRSGSEPRRDATLSTARELMSPVDQAARPVDPDHDASPWLVASADVIDALCRVVGESDYTAYEGVNSGGLNACYWVRERTSTDDGTTTIENLADVGHIDVEQVRTDIESARLYPLLRSGDVARWNATSRCSIILAQDPETRTGIPEDEMREKYPQTYRYFQRFEGDIDAPTRGTLRGRSLFRRYFKPSDPFYSMYGVGPYTMARWKVCWTRIDTRLRAAVVGPDDRDRLVLPQETITFVPFDDSDEAHYFCALFNSTPADALVRSFSTGKGFASAHVLDTVAIPDADAHPAVARQLAELSKRCHRAAADDQDTVADCLANIDEFAAQIWDIDTSDLDAIRRQFGDNPLR